MSQLTPDLANDISAACQAKASEAGTALGLALDQDLVVTVGEQSSYSQTSPPEGFHGKGLAVLLTCDGKGLVAVLPETTGLLPHWYSVPDEEGQEKLNTLAESLGSLLLPEGISVENCKIGHVENLSEALQHSEPAEETALLPLHLEPEDQNKVLSLIWPLEAPEKLFPAASQDKDSQQEESVDTSAEEAEELDAKNSSEATPSPHPDFTRLPNYTRSLLRVRVPVRVILANKKETVQDVVEMAPGTIIKFDKAYDQLLHLYVGNRPVAEGDAVKVGDKYGFRVNAMLLPDEHFMKLETKQAS